MCNCFRDDLKE